MIDPVFITFPSLLWKVAAKVPMVGRWLLRWRYPISRCHEGVLINMEGSQPRFEMGDKRPVPSLTSLLLQVHNHLPFAVIIELYQIRVSAGADGLLEAVQNLQLIVPPALSSQKPLPEVHLNDRQVEWVKKVGRESTYITVEFQCRCQSSIKSWEVQRSSILLALINADHSPM